MKALLGLLSCLLAPLAVAQPPADVEWFTRPGCPHCARAEVYLTELARRRPELRVEKHDVSVEPRALRRLEDLARMAAAGPAAVPAFLVRGRLLVGFTDAETTGREIEALLAGRPDGAVSPSEGAAGRLRLERLGLPLFTVLVGLADGFNPCAMWVLLFLLSLLVNVGSRGRMALVAGTFVAASGLVYFAFMAAWLNAWLVIGFSRGLQMAVGALALTAGAVHVKDFFAFKKGPSFSIPESAKPGLYERARRVVLAQDLRAALPAVIVLAVLVNLAELACTAGLPAVYTQILAAQGLSAGARYAYLSLYNAAYMLDDALVLAGAIYAFSRWKLGERGGRVLKLVSGATLAGLGMALLLKPEWLLWG